MAIGEPISGHRANCQKLRSRGTSEGPFICTDKLL
jgi:hypothetical protein